MEQRWYFSLHHISGSAPSEECLNKSDVGGRGGWLGMGVVGVHRLPPLFVIVIWKAPWQRHNGVCCKLRILIRFIRFIAGPIEEWPYDTPLSHRNINSIASSDADNFTLISRTNGAAAKNPSVKGTSASIVAISPPTGLLRQTHHSSDFTKFLVNDTSALRHYASGPNSEPTTLLRSSTDSREKVKPNGVKTQQHHSYESFIRGSTAQSHSFPQKSVYLAKKSPLESSNSTDANSRADKFDKDVDAIQVERKSRIRSVCNDFIKPRVHRPSTTSMTYLLYDDRHRVLYCMVPKVASTNWLTTLVSLSGRVRNVDLNNTANNQFPVTNRNFLRSVGIGFLHELTTLEAYQRMDDYFSFMFVRDPYERLLSAYNDKFIHSNERAYYHKTFGTQIVSQFRPKATYREAMLGNDVTFPEFIKFVSRSSHTDEHWKRYMDLCFPCYINYDYIGKMETLKPDTAAVLERGFHQNVPQVFPHNPTGHLTTSDVIKNGYHNVSTNDMEKLKREYDIDFLMFNYPQWIVRLSTVMSLWST